MNKSITILKNLKEQKSQELRKLEVDLETLINQETDKLRKAMEDNPLDIIKFIEGYGLKCYAFEKGRYFITDNCYDAIIQVFDGDIVIDDHFHERNHGGGEELYLKVTKLIKYDILPYCEKKIEKYIDQKIYRRYNNGQSIFN